MFSPYSNKYGTFPRIFVISDKKETYSILLQSKHPMPRTVRISEQLIHELASGQVRKVFEDSLQNKRVKFISFHHCPMFCWLAFPFCSHSSVTIPSKSCRIGIANAPVFPDPVSARPIISRPVRHEKNKEIRLNKLNLIWSSSLNWDLEGWNAFTVKIMPLSMCDRPSVPSGAFPCFQVFHKIFHLTNMFLWYGKGTRNFWSSLRRQNFTFKSNRNGFLLYLCRLFPFQFFTSFAQHVHHTLKHKIRHKNFALDRSGEYRTPPKCNWKKKKKKNLSTPSTWLTFLISQQHRAKWLSDNTLLWPKTGFSTFSLHKNLDII